MIKQLLTFIRGIEPDDDSVREWSNGFMILTIAIIVIVFLIGLISCVADCGN